MIRIGVSACLLGEPVRYDGGHKRSAVIVELLGSRFTWVPVCPEMEIGLGVPREPVRLTGDPHEPRMLGVSSKRDLTREMTAYAQRRARELVALDIAGYVLKSASPSCGLRDVRYVLRDYRVPPEVAARMGVLPEEALRPRRPRRKL